MSLVFYTAKNTRGSIVRFMLEELGVDYETKVLEIGTSMKSKEFLAINPMGKVPTIVHNDVVVTEAAAICAYLGDAFFDKGLAPALDDPKRGKYLRSLFFASGPLEQAISAKAFGFDKEEGHKVALGYGSYNDTINCLHEILGDGPYILGNQFSAADVYFGASLRFGLLFGIIEPNKTFENYVNLLIERDGFKRAAQLDAAM